MRFPGGVLGLIDCSFECPYRNRLEVVGTKAAIEFPGGVLPEAESELVFSRGDEIEHVSFPVADQYAEQVKEFCDAIRRGSLPEPAEDGLANMQVIEEIARRL
jgi:D-xylose 1-dehydrogenase (NADP+, D-xylono-1,5-lactone-forming)